MKHRAIILNKTKCLQREREESDANFPVQNVQRHSMTSLVTARSLANGPSWGGGGGEGKVCRENSLRWKANNYIPSI